MEVRDDYSGLPEEARAAVALPLRERGQREYAGGADLATLEADLRLLPSLVTDSVVAIERLLAPEVRVERVPIRRFLNGAIGSQEELERQLAALRDHCARLLAEGARVVLE